jgi:hypothetical protein
MKLSRMIALNVALLAAMATPLLVLPAQAQQELDPTWYDPWKPAPNAVAQPGHTSATVPQGQPKVIPASSKRPRNKKPARTRAPRDIMQAQVVQPAK